MPNPNQDNTKGSDYKQESFIGGINGLEDDTRLQDNQYRNAFNCRNRYGRLDLVLSSKEDIFAPKGVKQKMVTFGPFELLFVSGKAWYKHYTSTGWYQIAGFSMSKTAPKYWTCAVPVAETNYLRLANETNGIPDATKPTIKSIISGLAAGNLPGLVVQDNINQPRFIFINGSGLPECRVIQTYEQWYISFKDASNNTVNEDKREYVPIGNAMAFVDGVLYVVSPDKSWILRSVSGRPLDFIVAVSSKLVTTAPFKQLPAGDAYATAYSVGVGDISVIRPLSNDALFVGAANANFSVQKNTENNAPKVFGEYTFIRRFLFNATCLSDRAIIDSIGDTRFIDITGVRSFNAISQQGNEGRNVPFTANLQIMLSRRTNGKLIPIMQESNFAAAILYDDYELYALNTTFGPAIAVYDTITKCWAAFDVNQTGGKRIKEFALIELVERVLYAVTEDDKLYHLYAGPDTDEGEIRTPSVCANYLYGNQNVKMANPKSEVKLSKFRLILNNVTQSCTCSVTPHVNNRLTSLKTLTKEIAYNQPTYPSDDLHKLDDIDSELHNILFSTPNIKHGWKVFTNIKWNHGSITQFSMELIDITPQNPVSSQSL